MFFKNSVSKNFFASKLGISCIAFAENNSDYTLDYLNVILIFP